jgi:hypothetical protein
MELFFDRSDHKHINQLAQCDDICVTWARVLAPMLDIYGRVTWLSDNDFQFTLSARDAETLVRVLDALGCGGSIASLGYSSPLRRSLVDLARALEEGKN